MKAVPIAVAAVTGAAAGFLAGYAVYAANLGLPTSIPDWVNPNMIASNDWIVWTTLGGVIAAGLAYFFDRQNAN